MRSSSSAFAANVFHLAVLVADPAMAGEHGTKDVLGRLFHFSAGFRRKVVLQLAFEITARLLRRRRLHRRLTRDFWFHWKPLLTPPGNCFAFFFSGIYRHFDPPTTDILIF
jgi:hypothetical protein